jgi:hypothetical protein
MQLHYKIYIFSEMEQFLASASIDTHNLIHLLEQRGAASVETCINHQKVKKQYIYMHFEFF